MAVSFRECTLEDLEILQAFSRRLFFETFADMNTPENMAVYLDKAFAAEKNQGGAVRRKLRILFSVPGWEAGWIPEAE